MFLVLSLMLSPSVLAQDALVETRRMLPYFDATVSDAALGDFNGDGIPDVVGTGTGSSFPLPVTFLWHGVGGGRFVDASAELPTVPNYPFEAGDLDGDGDLDLFFAGHLVVTQTGGQLVLSQEIAAGAGADIALGDLDLDGDLDAFGAAWSPVPNVYTNDGAGQFSAVPGAVPFSGPMLELELADFDLDGDLDAFATQEFNFDRLLLNDGTATFMDTFIPGTSLSSDLTAVDLDGDGDVDVLLTDYFGNAVRVDNLGGGQFAATPIPSGQATRAFALDDWNGDGHLDAFLFQDAGAMALEGQPNGALLPGALAAPTYAVGDAALSGDVDGDGDHDLIVFVGGANETARLWLNDGAGALTELQERIPHAAFPFWTSGVATGDVNLDGTLDVLLGNLFAAPDRLFFGDGAGELVEVPGTLPAIPTLTLAVALHDLDLDGDLDALLGGFGEVRVLRNDGTGTLTEIPGALASGSLGEVTVIRLADVDGDLDQDVVLGDTNQTVTLWLNIGTGTFLPAAGLTTVLDWQYGNPLRLDDIDLDGDVDVVLVEGFPQELRVYRNNGAGQFAWDGLVLYTQTSSVVRLMDLGDVDQDGDLDLFIGAQLPDELRLLLNDGTGGFGAPVTVGTAVGLDSGGFAQVDADGRLDLHWADKDGLHIRYGDGAGGFGPETLQPEIQNTVTFAQLNIDAHADAFRQWGAPRVWINVRGGAVARETPARLGKSLALGIHGAPGDPWILAAAPASTLLALPPFGVLQLDPAQIWLLGSGVVAAGGRTDLALPVGPDPTLLGLAVHWQGLVGAPLAFTAREVSVVSGL